LAAPLTPTRASAAVGAAQIKMTTSAHSQRFITRTLAGFTDVPQK
jgi:hypothetical protein